MDASLRFRLKGIRIGEARNPYFPEHVLLDLTARSADRRLSFRLADADFGFRGKNYGPMRVFKDLLEERRSYFGIALSPTALTPVLKLEWDDLEVKLWIRVGGVAPDQVVDEEGAEGLCQIRLSFAQVLRAFRSLVRQLFRDVDLLHPDPPARREAERLWRDLFTAARKRAAEIAATRRRQVNLRFRFHQGAFAQIEGRTAEALQDADFDIAGGIQLAMHGEDVLGTSLGRRRTYEGVHLIEIMEALLSSAQLTQEGKTHLIAINRGELFAEERLLVTVEVEDQKVWAHPAGEAPAQNKDLWVEKTAYRQAVIEGVGAMIAKIETMHPQLKATARWQQLKAKLPQEAAPPAEPELARQNP